MRDIFIMLTKRTPEYKKYNYDRTVKLLGFSRILTPQYATIFSL